VVGVGDFEAQTRQCFANVAQILAEVGCGLGDIVSLTAYLADASHTAAYAAVRGELFAVDPPATTTVVAALLVPELLVEVQVIAVVP
jgi:enamine deaminase RidA (YjgF/YER057c/UK114 family)